MIAYLDLASGLSGDMFLGCLLDAGWSLESLRRAIAQLPLDEPWSVEARRVRRGELAATMVTVEAQGHHHRSLADLQGLLSASSLPLPVRDAAGATLRRLCEAEAAVHGVALEEVHLHELGAVDTIVDAVGVAAGLHELGVQEVYASPVPVAHGWVQAAHGALPLPAPATLHLLAQAKAPLVPGPGSGELVTPTGAALLAQHATFGMPPMTVERVGYGAGHRDTPWPNVARLWLGEPLCQDWEQLVELETNIDDMNPQLIPALLERLLAEGARDAWVTPVHMKKGRPGYVLSVLAPPEAEGALASTLLRETTTLGLRVHPVRRHVAPRETAEVDTPFGRVGVKLKLLGGGVAGASPEYEHCARLAHAHGVPVRLVWEAALAAAHRSFMNRSGTPSSPPSHAELAPPPGEV